MDALKIFEKVKVWQLFFAVGVGLILLGLTGEVSDVTITEGEEIRSIVIGVFFIVASVAFRLTPDPLKSKQVYVSIAQLEFASNFRVWEMYENATHDILSSDDGLDADAKSVKISTLRIELAIHQGLLETKTSDGTHYVRFIKPKEGSY